MARQFDVFRTRAGVLDVVIQSDLLDAARTRVVVPLLAAGQAGRGMRWLNPEIAIGASTMVLMPRLLATLTIEELGERVGPIARMRDTIKQALDTLLSGV